MRSANMLSYSCLASNIVLSFMGLQDCENECERLRSEAAEQRSKATAVQQDCEQQKLDRKTAEEALVDMRKSRTQVEADMAAAKTLEVLSSCHRIKSLFMHILCNYHLTEYRARLASSMPRLHKPMEAILSM